MTIWREASARPPQDRRLIPPVTLGNLPHDQTTIAEVLQSAGYATAHVGKWHLGDADHYPESHGFDVNVGGTHWGAPATYFFPYRGPFGQSREFRYIPDLPFGQPGEYLTDRLTSEALRIIEQVRDRPFFLQLAYHTVHTPLEGKPELVERYGSRLRDGLHHANPVLAAMVHSLDENVGRVLDQLDRLGLAEQTIVLFTSDNGGFVNEYRGATVTSNYPLRSGKGSLYEGGLRVPLIVRWPGVAPAGEVCAEPVITCDLFSTLLEAAGVAPPTGEQAPDGVSLLPLIEDPQAKLARDALFFHYPHYYATTTPASAIRSGDWKLLEYFEDQRVELYHLPGDVGEARDVAREHPSQAETLLRRLREWRSIVGAQMPTANANPGELGK
jgi:arylsulfatase A-like enzyme